MLNEQVVENWTNSLIFLANQENKLNNYLNDCLLLLEVLKKNDQFLKVMTNTRIIKLTRKKIIDEIFKNRISQNMLNFLKLLIDEARFIYVVNILKKLRKKINNINNLSYGKVYSAVPLTEDEINKIATKISKRINLKVDLLNVVDKSLIGGIKVEIRNWNFDGSIKGRLKQMQKSILSNKNEE